MLLSTITFNSLPENNNKTNAVLTNEICAYRVRFRHRCALRILSDIRMSCFSFFLLYSLLILACFWCVVRYGGCPSVPVIADRIIVVVA